MADLAETVSELSQMRRNLQPDILTGLRDQRATYVDRLKRVAQETFARHDLLPGTTISNPSMLQYGRRGRLQTVYPKDRFSMYVRNFEVPGGSVVAFPLKTVGVSIDGIPIIDPELDKSSYTVAHLPDVDGNNIHEYCPSKMRTDLVFTVDAEDYVTVDGMNRVTAAEYVLFDSIVTEFEHFAFPTTKSADNTLIEV